MSSRFRAHFFLGQSLRAGLYAVATASFHYAVSSNKASIPIAPNTILLPKKKDKLKKTLICLISITKKADL